MCVFISHSFLMPVEGWGAALYVCEDEALALTSQESWLPCELTAGRWATSRPEGSGSHRNVAWSAPEQEGAGAV